MCALIRRIHEVCTLSMLTGQIPFHKFAQFSTPAPHDEAQPHATQCRVADTSYRVANDPPANRIPRVLAEAPALAPAERPVLTRLDAESSAIDTATFAILSPNGTSVGIG